MTTHGVDELEKALKNIPKQFLSADLKASILTRLNKNGNTYDKQNTSSTKEEEIISNVDLVSIPSLGEFGELLEQVSPSLSMTKLVNLNQSDLILLKISKNYTIIFVEAATFDKNDKQEKKTIEKNEKNEKNEKEESSSNKSRLMLPKLVLKTNQTINDASKNGLSMNSNDEFNCLLIGSACCCLTNVNTSSTSLDDIFNNIRKYFGKSMSKEKINLYKNEIEPLWSLMDKLLNWKLDSKKNEKDFLIRLAMILCVSSKDVSRLSFVKDCIENEREKKNINETGKNDSHNGDTVVVTTGQTSGDFDDTATVDQQAQAEQLVTAETCMFLIVFSFFLFFLFCAMFGSHSHINRFKYEKKIGSK